MPDEIELKLALPESQQRRFLRHELLKEAVSRDTAQLVNIYYDTPDLALQRRGIAMRIRQQGRLWLQTVKCAGTTSAGLSQRPEWETHYRGQFDFSEISDERLRKWLMRPGIIRRVCPIFETRFRRTTWRLASSPGNAVLLMLDRGWVIAAGKRERISEIEIELASGDIAAIFRLALDLSTTFAVVPTQRSKAERGYRLFGSIPEIPVKAGHIELDADMTTATAFRRIAVSCLEHLQCNHEGALASDDAEYIHQIRVAIRRLRAAMRLFDDILPRSLIDELLPALRGLAAPLGAARDLDVLLTEIVAPVIRALPMERRLGTLAERLADRQRSTRAVAVQKLSAAEYGRLLLLAGNQLNQLSSLSAAMPCDTLAVFANNRLRRMHKKVLHLATECSDDDPTAFHALRIAIKRLRYALEFFGALLPKQSLQPVLRHLGKAQDCLGQLNDLAKAGSLMMECAGDDAQLREAVSLIGGWHGPRHRGLTVKIEQLVNQLRHVPLPRLRQ